jgi:hypothetical protein
LRRFGIGPMHGFVVVTQGKLRIPFRISSDLRAFRPSVAVARSAVSWYVLDRLARKIDWRFTWLVFGAWRLVVFESTSPSHKADQFCWG